MSTYNPCEPYRAYNRVEGRPRQLELDDAMAARIHDPLWMLARQYQFGEFKGEDAGSAILAKVAIQHTRITDFKGNTMTFQPHDETLPLETRVERLMPLLDHKTACRLGKKFLKILDKAGNGMPGYVGNMYAVPFIQRFPFEIVDFSATQAPALAGVQAREKSLVEAESFVRSLSGRALNGATLWDFLSGDANKMAQLVFSATPQAGQFIQAGHQAWVLQATQAWIDYVRSALNLPKGLQDTSWKDDRLEYSFDVRINQGNGSFTELHAEEYAHGHLDWYNFDVKVEGAAQGLFDENIRKREVLTVIPSEASFAGMPNARWWQMEDGTIDLGNLKANDTDIAKILVAQYAMKYSNDWLAVPYDLPCGSLSEIDGIVVTDTFGNRTYIEAAHKQNDAAWKGWNMFGLSISADQFATEEVDFRMFLPPAVAKSYESDEVERVKFIRDEMANMVWGIESIVPDGLGGGIDGYEVAGIVKSLYEKLETLQEDEVLNELIIPPSTAGTENMAATYKPQLKYMLGNTVSENWIPFIPVHKPTSNREILLQRASMPRISKVFTPHAVRPRTLLLRTGITATDEQPVPLFIQEEEVPRSGAVVKGTFQRARWFQGKVVTWYGRRKTNGRGEGSSGLRFDLVTDNF